MRLPILRFISAGFAAFVFLPLARPQAPGSPGGVPAVEPQDTPEAKLAVVLRSYSLLRDENDQLRAERDRLLEQKTSVEAQLGVAKGAIPIADQATGLREQLRQTQDQLAALSLENNELKTRLALAGPAPGASTLMPSNSTPKPDAVPAPVVKTASAPAADSAPATTTAAESEVTTPVVATRTHTVVAGDTLMRISKKYYGTPDRWTEIFVANPDVLKDERSLVIGRTLRIP